MRFFFKSMLQSTFRRFLISIISLCLDSKYTFPFLFLPISREDQELPWSPPMTTQVRVNAENIYTEILSITRSRDRDNDIFRITSQHSVSSGTGYVRERLEQYALPRMRPVCMTGRLIREASFYARKTRCEMQRDDATTTKRETNEPADARPLYLITPINPHDSSKITSSQLARCFV